MLAGMIQTNRHNEEHRGQDEDELLFKVNLTHIATTVPARWPKYFKPPQVLDSTPVPREESNDTLSKRELVCSKCKHLINVKHVQLRVADGYRTVYCTHCRWNGRATQLHCTCGLPWYLCEQHTADPSVHRSKHPPKKEPAAKASLMEVKFSTRPAPKVRGNDLASSRKRSRASLKHLNEHRKEVAIPRIAVSASTLC